jgi:hypothetical protein
MLSAVVNLPDCPTDANNAYYHHPWCGCNARLPEIIQNIQHANQQANDNTQWYVVLFARKHDNVPRTKPERTSIQKTANIYDVLRYGRTMPKLSLPNNTPSTSTSTAPTNLVPADAAAADTATTDCIPDVPVGIWNIVALIGPLESADAATKAYTLWTKNAQHGTANKVARGEAIAYYMNVPSYVDWPIVFESK